MLTRVIASVVLLPVFIVVVWLGGVWLDLVLALLVAIAGWELYRSCGLKRPWFYVILVLFAAAMVSVSMIREMYGLWYVWLIFIAAWGCDTGAYFVGRFFGKRKLAPKLSPKKTVAGAVGGVITAAVLCMVYFVILEHFGIWYYETGIEPVMYMAWYGAIGAVLGQAGDLSASAVKRVVGIKDYGNIMPGHGGVLDRFDSVIFVAPFAFIFVHFIM